MQRLERYLRKRQKPGRLIEEEKFTDWLKKRKFSIEGTFCLMHTISGV